MQQGMIWLGSAMFFIFGLLNINDPDWFIWLPTYLAISIMPLTSQKKLPLRVQKIVGNIFFIFGALIVCGILDTSIYDNADSMMTGLLEYQREGVGLILGSFWLYYQKI